jgi:bifunctional non-homologous end joining protein LigD
MSWFTKQIHPMLAVKGKPFSSKDFLYEIKWDGTRCIAFVDVEQRKLRLQNRRLADIAYRYPEFDFFKFLGENAVIDGEIVVLEKGKPSFQLLQKREQVDSRAKIGILSRTTPAIYLAFDVLYTKSNGWIMDLPLVERKKILKEIASETNHLLISESIEKKGEEFYTKAVELGLEGVIAKKIDSKYQPGKRSLAWIKIKKRKTVDCIIVGYLEGEGERQDFFGSLVLALRDGREHVHVGQVGTGFDLEFLDWFSKMLRKREVNEPVVKEKLNFKRNVHWVEPTYVCEVEFLEVTEDCKLRAPVFLRLRDDKNTYECTAEQLKS